MSVVIQRDEDAARAIEQAARRYLAPATAGIEAQLERLGLAPSPPSPSDPPSEPSLDDGGAVRPVAAVEIPDFRGLQVFAERVVRRARERLVAANEAHRREVQDDERRRLERDQAALAAREALTRTRRVLEGAIGPTAAGEVLGLDGPTPGRASELLSRLNDAIGRLESPGKPLPEPVAPGVALDWGELVVALAQVRDGLAAALEAVGEDRRDLHVTLEARQRAEEEFRTTYVAWTRILDGLYLFGDKRAFRDRLRPANGRRGGEAPADPGPTPGPEPVPPQPDPEPGPEPAPDQNPDDIDIDLETSE